MKLARLLAAGMPASHAEATAETRGETIGEVVVSRNHLDLHLPELRNDLTKWLIGLLLGQTAIISALVQPL